MTLFDRYLAVDWSASATPKTGADSIWIADVGPSETPVLLNPSTRREAAEYLADVLDTAGERVLIGVDASLGYPAGTASLFGLDGTPWNAMWQAIEGRSTDGERNHNNRFEVAAALNSVAGAAEGPFWGCPHDRFGDSLRRTKPAMFPVGEFRLVEQHLRTTGQYPKSCWQLLGAGSVGGQSLTLLPVLYGLLGRVEVWPFTTGLRPPDTSACTAVVAEIWPSMFVHETPIGMVPDAAQVVGTAAVLDEADQSGDLAGWFEPNCARHERTLIEGEEGWILGCQPS